MADEKPEVLAALSPVAPDKDRPGESEPLEEGQALCLSGGGYRAMLFHIGTLWRFNEAGYLPTLKRISCVSGGSITGGVLGMNWSKLGFDASGVGREFERQLVAPLRKLAGKTIDDVSVIGGILTPGVSISDRVIAAYRKHVFGDATLQDLPPDPPRIILNATNVQTGSLWRFMRPAMRDWRVGQMKNPRIELAVAVAASSAFPPVLSPARLELDPSDFEPGDEPLRGEPYMSDVVLTDGGVYDNLGLETAWKRYRTIFVSDGGGQMKPEPEPKSDWVRHSLRINDLIDNQVRNLRKRQVVGSFVEKLRTGAFWSIRTDIAKYQPGGRLPCPFKRTQELAAVATRLRRLDDETQERLINWGYAITDAALRRHFQNDLPDPKGFPYPRGV
jgi:NTE family protein